MKAIYIYLTLTCCLACQLHAAVNRNQNQSQEVRDMRTSLDSLRYEFLDFDEQLRIYSEKFKNQESIVEGLAKQLEEEKRSIKDVVKSNHSQVELKLAKIEKLLKNLTEDIRTLQTHVNQTAQAVTESQKRVDGLESYAHRQNEDLENMKTALMAVMEAFQVPTPISNAKVYQVKAGDTLGEIAMRHKTTAKVLKDLNQLKDDRIKIGQNLKLP